MLNEIPRRKLAIGAILLVALAAIVYMFAIPSSATPYGGLVTTLETNLTDAERSYIEHNLGVQQAALVAQQSVDDVDLNVYLDIARSYYLLGDLVGARETYEAFFELNPLHYAAWNTYGNILKRMEDVGPAEDAYRQAISLNPTEEHYRDLIKLIEDNDDDGIRDQEVLDLLEEAVLEVGQTSWFMVTIAEWYADHDNCQDALDHYEVAMTLAPENPSIVEDYEALQQECRSQE